MKKYSRVMARIDLDAIAYNMEQMHRNIDAKTKMIGVVKTDGYGHGAIPVARMLEAYEYVWGFATATLDEAVLLRKNGIRKPILVLGCIFPDQFEEMLKHEIRMTVYQEEQMQELSDLAVQLDRQAYFHVKLETGMSRLGFAPTDESVEAIKRIIALPHMEAEGIFTHFAKADEADKTYTKQQLAIFHKMTSKLKESGVTFDYEHCSNSAGIIDVREANCDLVRAGIAIYGLYPSQEVSKKAVELKPALSLISHVEYVKTISAGTSVSYGGTFVAEKEMKIATIPVGYGDGYPRSLSNKGFVLIHGKKAPILGRICMDQMFVDVTGIQAAPGDMAVIMGSDGGRRIDVTDIARWCGTISNEILSRLGRRLERIYI